MKCTEPFRRIPTIGWTVRRRQYLATTALLTAPLAGCAHPSNVLDMQEATSDRLADEASRSVSSESDDYRILQDAVENGSATASGTTPPIDVDEPVRFQGGYYDVSATETARRERTSYDIRVDYNPDSPDTADSIAYADLPEADRNALEGLIPPQGDPPRNDGFDMGTRYVYPENATESSVLVPTQQYEYIRYEESTYRVQFERGTVDEITYQYAVTEIAPSTEAYAEQLRSTYQFTLSGLSSAEREIVEEAIEGGYFDGASDAFRSVISRLRAHPGLETSDSYGTWLPEYEGTAYITYAEFPSDVTPAGREPDADDNVNSSN